MLKIPANDNKTYAVPSWTDFKTWIKRSSVAYGILAIACAVGIYAYGQESSHNTIDKINHYAAASCLNSIKEGSVLNKYNDFIEAAIDSRNGILTRDIAAGDTEAVKGDQKALARYRLDFASIPTKDQCLVPILKK